MTSLNAILPGGEARPTKEQLAAGAQAIFAVAECVREVRETPSGVLYAVLAGRVSLEGYQKILGVLSRAGLIEVTPAHLVRWIGPEVAA